MAGAVNKVILVGNIGSDPTVRTMQSGSKVVSFSLATSEQWKDKATGERREQTEWHRIAIFQPNLADVAERFLQKGTKLYVEGTLRTRKYQNQQGVDVYTTEIVLNNGAQMIILGGSKSMGEGSESGYNAGPSAGTHSSPAPREEISIDQIGDDIPF